MKKNNIYKKYMSKGFMYSCEGFSNLDIEKKIKLYTLPFPKVYLDFLKIAGKRFNSYNEIFWGVQELGRKNKRVNFFVNKVNSNLIFDEKYIVFWFGGEDYLYRFFNLEDGENLEIVKISDT